jgi:hypothetical protein
MLLFSFESFLLPRLGNIVIDKSFGEEKFLTLVFERSIREFPIFEFFILRH